MKKQSTRFVPVHGKFKFAKEAIVFVGGLITKEQNEAVGDDVWAESGLVISEKYFSEGTISATVIFKKVSHRSTFELIPFYNPKTMAHIGAALTNSWKTYQIRIWDGKQYQPQGVAGSLGLLESGKPYEVQLDWKGSQLKMRVNGVEVIAADIPVTSLPQTQAGFFCLDFDNVTVRDFNITTTRPKAFVVMQFSSPYDEVYQEVIQASCAQMGLEVVRIDEVPGPQIVIADIMQAIIEAKVVIADVSPANPNVFYEVGYSHAKGKPTILLAQKGTVLPFDVSPFRTIFYENSIAGKRKLEEELLKHLQAITSSQGNSI